MHSRRVRLLDITYRIECLSCGRDFFRPLEGDLADEADRDGEIEARCEFCDEVCLLEVVAP